MASLTALSERARSRLRSGVAITSLAQCVTELVDNSIDAGASCIAVRVDLSKFKLQVVDNGRGISQSDLSLIGERYVTSKCHTLHDLDHNLQHLGYRGEAVASIVNVSRMVEISSRHHLSQNTYDKVFLNGQVVGVSLAKTHRPSVGTTVTLLDFFYNMPVRRKTMVDVLELEQLKKAVECIALVHPSVSFSVRNDVTGALILQTHKTNSVLSNFGLLFASSRVGKMKEVCISHSMFTVSGFISTETHHNNSLQFIYVNRRVVKKTQVHTCVNNQLNNSLLTKKPSQKEYAKQSQATSPTRILDKCPVYVLMIDCPRSEYDICLEPAKTLVEFKDWDGILSALTSLTKKFLEQHHLYIGLRPSVVPGDQLEQTKQSDLVKQCADASPGGVKESLIAAVQSRVVRRRVNHGSRGDVETTVIANDPSSHNLSAFKGITSPQTIDSTPAIYSEPPSNHPSPPALTPYSFLSSTYQDKPSPKPLLSHSSPRFLVPYRSPSPGHSHSILSKIQSNSISAQVPFGQSLRPQVYSPLHASTVSARLAQLAQCKDNSSVSTISQDLPTSHCSLLCSTPAGQDTLASSLPSSTTTDSRHCSLPSDSLDSGFVDTTTMECSMTVNELSTVDIQLQDNTNVSSSQKPLWKKVLDPASVRKIFVHSITGNCSYENPTDDSLLHDSDVDSTTSLCSPAFGTRPLRAAPHLSYDYGAFIPRPKSQQSMNTSLSSRDTSELLAEHRENDDSQNVKWRDHSEVDLLQGGSSEKSGTSFEALLKNWRNPTFQPGQEDVLDIGYGAGSRRQIKVHNLVNKYTFTKEMFRDLIVLNQIDCKFIACLMSKEGSGGKKNLLVMVDQHAAHERVRLEALINDLYEDSSATKGDLQVKKSSIQPPLVLMLSPSEMSMAKHFKQQLGKIGVSTSIDNKGKLLVSSLPSVFMEREVSEVRRGRPAVALSMLQEMIIKHLELLQATGGVSMATPTTITHVLNSQACHGAIKFGDPLTLPECEELIKSLSKCRLPFQCAHGRPSVVPIVDLDSLNRRYPPQQAMQFPLLAKLLSNH